jgi:hypothetical protein
MRTTISKNQTQSDAELGSRALHSTKLFFDGMSLDDANEMLDDLLKAYIYQDLKPSIREIKGKAYYLLQLSMMLDELDGIIKEASPEKSL